MICFVCTYNCSLFFAVVDRELKDRGVGGGERGEGKGGGVCVMK